MNARLEIAGIILQPPPNRMPLLLCLLKRLSPVYARLRARSDPACQEWRERSTVAMLLESLKEGGASEKLYAACGRIRRQNPRAITR